MAATSLEPAGVDVFGVRHEERVDRVPVREGGRLADTPCVGHLRW